MPRETRSSAKRKDPVPEKPAKKDSKRRCVRGEKPPEAPTEAAASTIEKRSRRSRSSLPTSPTNPASLPSSAPAPAEELPSRRASEGPSKAPAELPQAASNPSSRPDPMAARQPSGGDDDERDFGRNMSANSALQGLLKKLGAGYEDLLPGIMGVSGGRLKGIISGLKQIDDESQQLSSLTELCELLSISSEDSLASFPVETIVPLLVQLLNMEHNPDIMLLAARALTFMADVMPSSCSAIVRHEAIPAFCARLLTIEYIDLAEQSLQALEKLSHEYSHHLLQNGGLLAVLSYLDFFPTSVQRVAVATAANMCRRLSAEHHGAVSAAVPILTNLLQYQDVKVVDSACIALSHIADSYSSRPQLLSVLNGGDLVSQSLQLLAISESGAMTSQISLNTYYSLLKMLSTCSAASPEFAHNLLTAGVLDVLRQLLATSTLVSSLGSSSSVLRSADQLSEVITLSTELLPSIPGVTVVMLSGLPVTAEESEKDKEEKEKEKGGAVVCARSSFMSDNPSVLRRFGSELLPLLLQVFWSTVMPQVRHSCLCSITKILFHSTAEMLEESLKDLPMSSFIAGLLSSRDNTVVAYALQMSEILMSKLPNIFHTLFLKEGVVHGIEQLAANVKEEKVGEKKKVKEEKAVEKAESSTPVASTAAAPSAHRVTRSTASKLKDALLKGTGMGKSADQKQQQQKEQAPAPTPPQPTPPVPDVPKSHSYPPSLSSAIASRAAQFRNKYFVSQANGGVTLETEGLKLMRQISSQLCTSSGSEHLKQLITVLGVAEGSSSGHSSSSISVFEFLMNGAVKHLLECASGSDLIPPGGKAKAGSEMSESEATAQEEKHLARLAQFVNVGFAPGSGETPPVCALVTKLLAGLSAVETFPVLCSRANVMSGSRMMQHAHGSMGGASRMSQSANAQPGSLSSGLMALTQPFKLRLARHSSETSLKEYSSNIVLIEPLATMGAIEEFLWQRVYRPRGPASAPSTAAKPAAAARTEDTPEKRVEGRVGAATAAKSPEAPASAPPTSKAQAIPESQPGNRRVTRSQAARTEAEEPAVAAPPMQSPTAATAAAALAVGSGGYRHDDDDEDDEMGHEDEEEEEDGLDMEQAMFEGDEEYEEEIDGEEDDEEGDLNLGAIDVHDLHVGTDVDAAAGAGPSAAGTVAAAAAAPPAAAPSDSVTSLSMATAERMASAAAAAAAAASRSAWQSSNGRGASSSAAAAAAAAAAPPPPKLSFFLGDTKLKPGMTVFQAIQQTNMANALAAAVADQEEAREEDTGLGSSRRQGGRRMWDDVYTLHYRVAEEGDPTGASSAADASAGESSASEDTSAAGVWSKGPLGGLLTSGLPADLSASAQCKEVLQLLQILEKLNRLGPRLSAVLSTDTSRPAVAELSPAIQNGHIARECFHSSKVASKLAQQLKDVLVICGGCLPPWCKQLVFQCKFLFPLEVRRRFFYCTALGMGRALQHMQQLHAAEVGGAPAADRELRVGRLQRQKVRVSRKRILESAIKVMELYAKQRAVLELEYFGEVGTGLGPTLEFYTLLSHELQRKSLGLWRHEERPERASTDATEQDPMSMEEDVDSDAAAGVPAAMYTKEGNAAEATTGSTRRGSMERPAAGMALAGVELSHDASEFVYAPFGLFPASLPEGERVPGSKVLQHFCLLGRTLGKALQDSRLMDLPLNLIFYRAVMGRPIDLYDISSFDPQIGGVLERMSTSVRAQKAAGDPIAPVLLDGVPVEDLALTFTLPGKSDYELCPGGADKLVDSSNVEEYIDAVVDAMLGSGIQAQLQAFKDGFNEVFPLKSLDCFYEDEIEALLCGSGEAWTVQSLTDSIKFDHGYTQTSEVVRNFVQILAELNGAEQRRFLRFVTGCPRLPPGGLSALQPRLTVVRKHPSSAPTEDGSGSTPVGSFKDGNLSSMLADSDLPSVMTCANYIKLPPYSSKEVMRDRLMFAITEGQGSFDLS